MPCKGCEKECKCTPEKCGEKCKCSKDNKCNCHGNNAENGDGTPAKSCCSKGGGEQTGGK